MIARPIRCRHGRVGPDLPVVVNHGEREFFDLPRLRPVLIRLGGVDFDVPRQRVVKIS